MYTFSTTEKIPFIQFDFTVFTFQQKKIEQFSLVCLTQRNEYILKRIQKLLFHRWPWNVLEAVRNRHQRQYCNNGLKPFNLIEQLLKRKRAKRCTFYKDNNEWYEMKKLINENGPQRSLGKRNENRHKENFKTKHVEPCCCFLCHSTWFWCLCVLFRFLKIPKIILPRLSALLHFFVSFFLSFILSVHGNKEVDGMKICVRHCNSCAITAVVSV